MSATERSVIRSSAAARSSRRVSRYACGDSPNVRRNSRLKCARERPAARGQVVDVERLGVAGVGEVLGAEQVAGGRDERHRHASIAIAGPLACRTSMTVIYTYTDEAPALATHSFLPVIEAFAGAAGVDVELRDISLAGRILAQFGLRRPTPSPSSASWPRRPRRTSSSCRTSAPRSRSSRRRSRSCRTPATTSPSTRTARDAYDRVKGSAVNPVLREGNSDRRAPDVGQGVRAQAPALDGRVVARLGDARRDDGRRRLPLDRAVGHARRGRRAADRARRGRRHGHACSRRASPVQAGEIVDAAVMRRARARRVPRRADRRRQGAGRPLLAAPEGDDDEGLRPDHLRPRGADVLRGRLRRARRRAGRGRREPEPRPGQHPHRDRAAARRTGARRSRRRSSATYETAPRLAMVDSDRGITNLHVPSDVIVDASMPAMIRSSGQMWNADGEPQDAKAVIPDSSYAALYAETIAFCREHGAFDPATMGTTPNVGLMAQKAEEYGSHDKTFEIESAGTVRVVDGGGRDAARARRRAGRPVARAARPRTPRWPTGSGSPSSARGRPARRPCSGSTRPARTTRRCSRRSSASCAGHDTDGLQIEILPVAEATRFTLERAARGEDTISVTGNVLRDYLTDLFPILELGTSAKMLSIVPLMNGGGLFETGRRRLGAQARPAAREGEPPALGLARRVPRARRLAREGGRGRARAHARRGDRPAARGGAVAVAQGRRARQPRQPLLPRALLGAGAGGAGRRRGAGGGVRAARGAARGGRGDDRRRAGGGPGRAGRPRRLLPRRPRQGDGGDAAERRRSTPRSTRSSPPPPAPSAARRATRRRRRPARPGASARPGGSRPSRSTRSPRCSRRPGRS